MNRRKEDGVPEVSARPTKRSDQVPKEQSEWVISIRKKLKEAQQYAERKPWENWFIYQVPRRLRNVHENRKAYEPQTVSIGPYHHGHEQVQDMDSHKWVALHQMLKRTGQDIHIYIDSVREIEEQVRECYQHEFVHLSSEKFVEMMVLDGCFIIELFICYLKADEMVNHPVFFDQRIIDDILLDMVMLGNQIPLFVIGKLLKIMSKDGNTDEHHKEQAVALALNFFNPEWLTGKPMSRTEFDELKCSLKPEECLHILDVFRQSLNHEEAEEDSISKQTIQRRVCNKLVHGCLKRFLHNNPGTNTISRHGQLIYRVTQLREGGIKFKKRTTNCFWDIKFNKGVLEIPSIWIQDSTATILLNVAAFEHCHLINISDAVISSYVVFMECLIKSPEDVIYLHRQGIIQHLLGHDAEVVDMFKSISKEMLVEAHGGYYAEVSKQVNAYYNQRRHRWQATLVHQYLNNPWAIISLIVAFILLLLTAIQSFYAVYAYYKPNSK